MTPDLDENEPMDLDDLAALVACINAEECDRLAAMESAQQREDDVATTDDEYPW